MKLFNNKEILKTQEFIAYVAIYSPSERCN